MSLGITLGQGVVWEGEEAGSVDALYFNHSEVSRGKAMFSFEGSNWGGFESPSYLPHRLVL